MVEGSTRRREGKALFIITALLVSRVLAEDLQVGENERFQKIQDAIEAAVDLVDSVYVKPGTYREAIDFKGKKIRVASISGAATTTIDAAGLPKTAVVTFKTGENEKSVLEGFTLTGGTGAPLNPAGTVLGGGGIFIDKAAPTIKNCAILKNSATRGGGVLVQGVGGGGLIEGCEIAENLARVTAGQAGGGIAAIFSGGNPDLLTIKNSRILKNAASASGAVLGGGAFLGGTNRMAKVVVLNSIFQDNLLGTQTVSGGDGGGLQLDTVLVEMEGGEVSGNRAMRGGGIGVRNLGATSFIKGVKVSKNVSLAAGGGGGLYLPTGGNSRLTISSVEFAENTAGVLGGGGILVEAGSPVIESCRFIGNSTTDDGGAIRYLATGVKTRVNATLFLGNRAGGQGGAIYVSSSSQAPVVYTNCIFARNESAAEGGAVFNRAPGAGIVKFFYSTFYANRAARGVGGFHQDNTVSAQAFLSNCILWSNAPSDYPSDPTSAGKISYSDVLLPAKFPANRPGMLSELPGFVDAEANPPDLHIQATSKLVDKGNAGNDPDGKAPAVEKDFDGKPRFTDGDGDGQEAPDLGAYESEARAVGPSKFIRGDANDDAKVDLSDAVAILGYMFLAGEKPKCMDAADADDTGQVDLTDSIYILTHLFLAGPRPPPPESCSVDDPGPDTLDPCQTTSC